MPQISIIVPVYNKEEYLAECMDSLINQTFSDIEILCVDDCSTDRSPAILREYQKKDPRVIPIFFEENRGSSYARKVAGLRSRGRYVMFCDADDMYLPNACEVVMEEMGKSPVDILHFRSRIGYFRTFDTAKKKSIAYFIEPYLGEVSGDLIQETYIHKKWNFTLWNKAFNGESCRKAFALASEKNFSVATDVYAFFLIAYFCKTYRGIPVELNYYRYGTGVTGFSAMNGRQFSKTCEKLTSAGELSPFLDRVHAEQKYYQYADAINEEIKSGILNTWFDSVMPTQTAECFWYLAQKMSPSELVGMLAEKYWDRYQEITKRVSVKRHHYPVGKPVARIAVYYRCIRNGGAQAIVARMVNELAQNGYYVLLVTDEPATEEDYAVPENVERVVLPDYSSTNGSNYQQRAYAWEYLVKSKRIDTVVYHQGITRSMLWDFCVLKALGVNLVVQLHSVFNSTMWYSLELASCCPYIYQLADRIVCLSRMDTVYWRNFSIADYIPNPVQLCRETEMSDLSGKNIVWVGRISAEKQLDKMLETFAIVRQEVPDATLTVVGDGVDPQLLEKAKELARLLGVWEGVSFEGFHLDVNPYYQKASVFAMTSKVEGFSLTLGESKAYGLPAVMFDIPWIEYCRDGGGILRVPQGDVLAMAQALIGLLNSESERKRLGKLARESVEDLAARDYFGQWKTVFDSFEQEYDRMASSEDEMILDCLFSGIQQGTERIKKDLNANGGNSGLAEVVSRHEDVINRHNASINHHWEIQKWHEERISALERKNTALIRKILSRLKRELKRLFSR